MNDKIPMARITKVTGISRTRIYNLVANTRERGQKQDTDMIIEVEHVQNAPRSGRPSISPEAIACVLKVVLQNSTTHGFSCKTIGKEVARQGFQVAPRMIWKILTQAGYSQCKLTVKPGLNKENKLARLAQCLKREHQTIEDQGNVIFTDETAVQLGGTRRKRRVWRKPDEAYHKHVIRRRWKGFSEFIFQRVFSYNKKGLCYI